MALYRRENILLELHPPYDVSIIIVNYNTADFLPRCLESISAQTNVNHEVIVVDNASQDSSHDIVKSTFPWVTLITNRENLGFARANNQALKRCTGKYVYLLNPDTEVRQGTLQNMIEFMDAHLETGLAGTQLLNPDGTPHSSFERRYPGQRYARKGLDGLRGDIAWVMGSSMIARRHIINSLGGFDERYFLYGEDMDICLSMRKAGWLIGYIRDAVVVHWGGQSERGSTSREVWNKKFKAETIFFHKHYSKRACLAIKWANLCKAYYRLLTLELALPFTTDRTNAQAKLEKYQIITKVFRDV